MNPDEPTNEQLARFALTISFGPGQSESQVATLVEFFEAAPGFREEWLRRHRQFQADLDFFSQTTPGER